MKCPKFHAALINDFQRCKDGDDNCLERECAWWSEEANQCDPTGLLPWLIKIEAHLEVKE